ncbi:MAG: hypothetical protein LBR18_01025 [Tannerella sp.]|jgi:hypothetical protein|nr:hypothetical protein [Tannerella sp.]
MKKKTITENKVIVENGRARIILTEKNHKNGMTIEESRRLCHEMINKARELLSQNEYNN